MVICCVVTETKMKRNLPSERAAPCSLTSILLPLGEISRQEGSDRNKRPGCHSLNISIARKVERLQQLPQHFQYSISASYFNRACLSLEKCQTWLKSK